MDEREIALSIFSRNVVPRIGSSAFGLPILSDLPAANTIAAIIVLEEGRNTKGTKDRFMNRLFVLFVSRLCLLCSVPVRNTFHQSSCAFTRGPRYSSLNV